MDAGFRRHDRKRTGDGSARIGADMSRSMESLY
jgi:hypothetical protein